MYELLDGFTGRMVNTGILGKAFEPEQPFENPDGTPIQFDADYFGSHRGVDVVPGHLLQTVQMPKSLSTNKQ